MKRLTFFWIMMMSCLPLLLRAQGQAVVSGTVTDRTAGDPLPAATVSIAPASDTSAKTYTSTDGEGAFAFRSMAVGSYVVSVSYVGFKPMEKRVKEIDRLLFHIGNFEANKPVHAKYAAIRWKKPKEKFAADHKEELDAYNAALRYFKVHLDGAKYSTKKLAGEQAQLSENIASKTEALTAVQEDVKILRDVRHWLNQVLPSEQYRQTAEPGKKPSIQQAVKGREQRIREEQAEKRQTPRRQQKQDMEL